MTLTIGQTFAADEAAELQNRLLARGRRDTSSSGSASTTPVPVIRLDDIPVSAGAAITVRGTGLHTTSTVAGDGVQVEIRYTTDGSTPTAGSTVLPGSRVYNRVGVLNSAETKVLETTYVPATAQTLSLLLCVLRSAGTGTVTLFANATDVLELKVIYEGTDPTDTGTDL